MSGNLVNPQPSVPTFNPGPVPPFTLAPNPWVTVAQFRTDFPEFTAANFPDATVQRWLDVGGAMVRPERWQDMSPLGSELICAHMLTLFTMTGPGAAGGGGQGGGLASGIVNSKSVSKVSIGYDTSSTAMEGAGPWNYTKYGEQFYWLMLMAGTGGYETLAVGFQSDLVGVVWTWQMGVQWNLGS